MLIRLSCVCHADESEGPSERDGGSRGLRLCWTVNAAAHQVSGSQMSRVTYFLYKMYHKRLNYLAFFRQPSEKLEDLQFTMI